jgi:hypothetical protein
MRPRHAAAALYMIKCSLEAGSLGLSGSDKCAALRARRRAVRGGPLAPCGKPQDEPKNQTTQQAR